MFDLQILHAKAESFCLNSGKCVLTVKQKKDQINTMLKDATDIKVNAQPSSILIPCAKLRDK